MSLKWGTVGVLVLLVLIPANGSTAQESVEPSTAPPASPTPIDAILQPPPTATPRVKPTPVPTAPPPPTPSPIPPPVDTPAATAAAPVHVVPVIPRTAAKDTSALIEQLALLTEWGPSLEDIAQEGMGRLPVKGPSRWSDDWLNARYNPDFHLHRGLDIFAEAGTPVRATTAGVVTRIASYGPGGNSVTMLGGDGATYYFAHLQSHADGLEVGQNVELGTLLGLVGDTGNASGGAPHLHFEIRDGGVAVPPKPIVDEWLAQAEAAAGDFIEAQRLVLELER